LSLRFYSKEVAFSLPQKRLTGCWLKEIILNHRKQLGKISVIFVDDFFLLEMNRTYLSHDYFTDIITFDNSLDLIVSGELYISIDRVKENATLFNTTFFMELYRVMAHGVLHLIGFKDKSKKDAALMSFKEEECLKLLGDKYFEIRI